mmetsp:Transcript_17627/g.28077  ORF Transcript_17627/g.28077 Transcript_17627/m.28077 type:complete len:83 (+) Transcript_17627:209-457(+)
MRRNKISRQLYIIRFDNLRNKVTFAEKKKRTFQDGGRRFGSIRIIEILFVSVGSARVLFTPKVFLTDKCQAPLKMSPAACEG